MNAKRHYSHGKTPAAIWGSVLAAVGFLVLAIGFVMPLDMTIIAVGAGIVLLAIVVGGTLHATGFGQ